MRGCLIAARETILRMAVSDNIKLRAVVSSNVKFYAQLLAAGQSFARLPIARENLAHGFSGEKDILCAVKYERK